MLLDLFKQKQGDKDAKGKELPKPASQPVPSPQPKPAQPAQPANPAATRSAVPHMGVAQQASASNAGKTQISSSITVDDIYPILLRKIKDEFKDVSGEAEKLKEMNAKMDKMTKTFEDMQTFVESSKTSLSELKGKTEKFDVALYELLTNQFNPFIKKSSLENSAPQSSGRLQSIAAIENPVPVQPQPQVHVEEKIEEIGNMIKDTQSFKIDDSKQEMSRIVEQTIDNDKPDAEPERKEELKEENKREANDFEKNETGDSNKEAISKDEYEEELRNVMQKTKEALTEQGGNTMYPSMQEKQPENPENVPHKNITIHENIQNKSEQVSIPDYGPMQEQKFMEGAKRLVPGVKRYIPTMEQKKSEKDHSLPPEYSSKTYSPPHIDREQIREQIMVEDVLDVPKEGSESHEVSETLSFKETWNDPDAQHLEKTPPKLKRFDLKELLGKFLNKHDFPDKKIDDFEEKEFFEEHEPERRKPRVDIALPLAENIGEEYLKDQTKQSAKSGKPENFERAEAASQADHHRYSAEHQILNAELHRITQVNITDPRQYFWFSNGKVAKNLPDFVMVLKELDENTFNSHTAEGKNDFANWVRGVFHSDIVANVLMVCKTKEDMLGVLE